MYNINLQSIKWKGNQLFQLNNSLHWKKIRFWFFTKDLGFFSSVAVLRRFWTIISHFVLFLRTVIAKWYWPKYGSPCIHSYYFIMRILYAFERFVNNYYHVKKNKWYKLVFFFNCSHFSSHRLSVSACIKDAEWSTI